MTHTLPGKTLKTFRRYLSEVEKRYLSRRYYAQSGPRADDGELYGVISYMPSSNETRYCNLGDEFQSIAAAQFLPRVDAFVPRDNLNQLYPRRLAGQVERLSVILAARFYRAPRRWPPPSYVAPIFVGFRVEPDLETHRLAFSRPRVISYLNEHGPIGCRDQDTCDFLQAFGVETVLTGCITLTLQRNDFVEAGQRNAGDVLIIDVPEPALRVMPREIRRSARYLSQILPTDVPQTQAYRTEMAVRRLRALASARLVITTKVHATLASRALGTPVVLLDIGGDIASRISGMRSLVHYFKVREDEVSEGIQEFNWVDPPTNPGSTELSALIDRSTTILARHGLEIAGHA